MIAFSDSTCSHCAETIVSNLVTLQIASSSSDWNRTVATYLNMIESYGDHGLNNLLLFVTELASVFGSVKLECDALNLTYRYMCSCFRIQHCAIIPSNCNTQGFVAAALHGVSDSAFLISCTYLQNQCWLQLVQCWLSYTGYLQQRMDCWTAVHAIECLQAWVSRGASSEVHSVHFIGLQHWIALGGHSHSIEWYSDPDSL